MKIIEALKKAKDLTRKAEDIRQKVAMHHADVDIETPVYGTVEKQREQIDSWLQSHRDIVKEIGSLRYRIQKTNIATKVSIDINGKAVTKSISEWIARRKDLATLDGAIWKVLNDKGIKPTMNIQKSDGNLQEIKVRRYYDPVLRDNMQEEFRSEPHLIDGSLEVVNAVTELLD